MSWRQLTTAIEARRRARHARREQHAVGPGEPGASADENCLDWMNGTGSQAATLGVPHVTDSRYFGTGRGVFRIYCLER